MGREIWAVTAYFNPGAYHRRLSNYRMFRRHLRIPLLTVELGYGEAFELETDRDADILIQIPSSDRLWQRERLVNVALAALPSSVNRVCSLDCDFVFHRDDWPQLAIAELDKMPLVQLYSEIAFQPRDCVPGDTEFENPTHCRRSFASLIDDYGDIREVCLRAPRRGGFTFPGPTGLAWAFRRELFGGRGMYDMGILGGGDIHMVAAAAGCQRLAIKYHCMNAAMRRHYLSWAVPFEQAIAGRVGCLPGRVSHLWHGVQTDRRYATRYQDFSEFDFDPYRDLAINEMGVWRWNSDKPAMHRYVADYFNARQEDG